MTAEPAWWRYRNEPDSLYTIMVCNAEEAGRSDEWWGRWLDEENEAIRTWMQHPAQGMGDSESTV